MDEMQLYSCTQAVRANQCEKLMMLPGLVGTKGPIDHFGR